MKHTSLQNIISSQPTRLEQSEIRKLFQRQQYPCFELQDLRKPELMKKASYVSFLGLLQEWNKNVSNPAKEINQSDYCKNEFIFSWLKWVGVQSSRYVDSSLLRLQTWYNNSRLKQPKIWMRKQNLLKSYAEEWQIRNSYKSNLPLQIGNYKRRALFQLKTAVNSPKGGQQKENLKVSEPQDKFMEPAKMKKQNCFLRQVREQQEMEDYLCNFRKSKVQFYKNLTKNFYKKEFSRDKLESETPKIKDYYTKNSQTKDYRIKTSTQGFRQFTNGEVPTMNQTEMLPFYHSKKNSVLKSDFTQTDNTSNANQPKSLNTTNIDGLGLLSNPFEIKIKKKKRI